MSLENILCPAQQIEAVIELLVDNAGERIKDDTVLHALYSIMDNASRMTKAIDECFQADKTKAEILIELGVFDKFRQRMAERASA